MHLLQAELYLSMLCNVVIEQLRSSLFRPQLQTTSFTRSFSQSDCSLCRELYSE